MINPFFCWVWSSVVTWQAVHKSMEDCQIYGAHYKHAIPVQPAKDPRDACREILEGKVGADERTHFKYAQMNDPDMILYEHIKNDVAVTYNRAIVQQVTE